MKKSVILALSLSLITSAANAQFYMRLGMGYAFPQAAQTLDGTGQPYSGTQNNPTGIQTYSLQGASFSAGLQGVVGVGYMFSDHVGIQLDGVVGLAPKKYTYNDNGIYIDSVLSNVSIVQKAQTPFFLIPSLVVQSGGPVWNIYARLGVALPLASGITEDQLLSNAPGTGAYTVDDFTIQIKNSFSLGFAAAAGVSYKLSDRISLWGELNMLSMSVYIKQTNITNLTENGASVPLSYINGSLTTNYSKTAKVDSSQTNLPTYSQPFSNVGVHVGISFRLSDKKQRRDNSGLIDNDDKNFKRRSSR